MKIVVYVPARAPVGMATEMAGVNIYMPIPVFVAVPKNWIAGGGITPAGMGMGSVTPLTRLA